MSEAPERIWVWPDHIDEPLTGMSEVQQPEHVEYVRADKLEELAAKASDWEERFWKRDAQADRLMQERDKAEAALAEAKAENEALRRALTLIDALDPEEHVYGCSADALRGLVIQMGQLARNAGGNNGK